MVRNIFISLLLAGLFFSCSTETTAPQGQGNVNDTEIIQAIASAPDKMDISIDYLPARAQDILNTDYAESYIDAVMIAPELGYEVITRREMGTSLGESYPLYFDLNGRELHYTGDSVESRDHKRGGLDVYTCFTVVYPITFVMPDSSTITGDDGKSLCTAIKEWYMAHPDVRERPALQYPVDVVLRDSTTLTINSDAELKDLINGCRDSDRDRDDDHHGDRDGKHAACFTLQYPVTYIMPDSTEITVEDSTGWGAIKDWYANNPDSKERPSLKYPVDVDLRDGTTMTINNADEMQALKADCYDSDRDRDDDHHGDRDGKHAACFSLQYPVTYIMPDSTEITVQDSAGWAAIKDWYAANPDLTGRPSLQYPVDVVLRDGTTITINNADEMRALKEDCNDSYRDGDHRNDHDGDHDWDGPERGEHH